MGGGGLAIKAVPWPLLYPLIPLRLWLHMKLVETLQIMWGWGNSASSLSYTTSTRGEAIMASA